MRELLEKAGFRLQFSAGDIVTVKDKDIRFPRNLWRKPHARRFCLVLSNKTLCDQYDVVLVAPCSASTEIKSESDYESGLSPTNGLEKDSIIHLGETQSIHRDWIIGKMGSVSSQDWDGILKQIFWNIRR